jgi:hypothetical protein
MTGPFTGGCLCGALRYECDAEPMFPGHCHCNACQKASGSPFVTIFAVPKSALKITGEVKYYESRADSGNIARRGFCPVCGGRVLGGSSGMPDLVAIMAGSMDDPSLLAPGMIIFAENAPPWCHMDPALPKFPGMPDLPGG